MSDSVPGLEQLSELEATVQQEMADTDQGAAATATASTTTSPSPADQPTSGPDLTKALGEGNGNAASAPLQGGGQSTPFGENYSCCGSCANGGATRENDRAGRRRPAFCVCVVPSSDRRSGLSEDGCKTCACKGCHPEDVAKRERGESTATEAPVRRPREHDQHRRTGRPTNACCFDCMKSSSRNGVACVCQVPSSIRRTQIGPTGCGRCGCSGCNPEDRGRGGQPIFLQQPQYVIANPGEMGAGGYVMAPQGMLQGQTQFAMPPQFAAPNVQQQQQPAQAYFNPYASNAGQESNSGSQQGSTNRFAPY